MGEGFEKIQPGIIDYVKKYGVKLGTNPGTIQLKAGYKALKPIFDVAEVLIVNKEEAERLIGAKHNNIDFKRLLRDMLAMGPKNVVITDGANGAYAHDGKQAWFMPIFPVPVVERTGAGDSFSTGVIAALAHGEPLQEGLRWGTFNSASVIQDIGPQRGLLHKANMAKFLKQHPDIVAEAL
jgi:sugar/nucleoside kinase (ribokinase family)